MFLIMKFPTDKYGRIPKKWFDVRKYELIPFRFAALGELFVGSDLLNKITLSLFGALFEIIAP